MRILIAIIFALTCTPTFAHVTFTFVVDGIKYKATSIANTISVTSNNSKYEGDIVIPASVTYEGKTYDVTEIESYAFMGCDLTSITIPDGVTSIGPYAFEFCSRLTSITIPENSKLTSIGVDAFYGCSRLTSITIPDGVTSIGNSAFCGCSGLTSINIPDGVTSIGNYAFYKCSSLTSITIPENSKLTSIGEDAFYGCSGLTSINIPDGVTSIGHSAFGGCSSLTSINIPDGVTSIGNSAFSGCSGLTSINIPDGVTSIGEYAFSYCRRLTSVTIGSGVTSIGNSAFNDCSGLTRVDYRGTIGDWVKINFVRPSSNPLYYAGHLYINGEEVTDVVIPDGVTSIGDYAFYECSGLTSITIPNSVTSIGYRAFYGCRGLTTITIPDGVTSIGNSAFYDCSGLTRVDYGGTIGDWVKINYSNEHSNPLYYAEHLYIDGKEVTDVVIPDGVTSIGNYAFYKCRGLTTITIPDGVTSIGEFAFNGCSSLTSITIPNSVTSIGYCAFEWCSLKNVHTDMDDPSILKSALGTNKKYIVPCTKYETLRDTYVSAGLTIESEHNLVWSDALAETCTINGHIEGYTCTFSGKHFADAEMTTEIAENSWVIPAKGHSLVKHDAVGKTCTTDGNSEYYTCSVCGKHYSDAEATAEIAADSWMIPASHDLVWSDAVAATDEADGHVEGYTCNVCGRHFADSKASVEILEKDWIDKGWSLSDDGVLTITRNYDYWEIENYPWYSSKDDIKSVVIKDGVTSIGRWAFDGCNGLASVTIPNSVTSIGGVAFYVCSGLTRVDYGGTIGDWVKINFSSFSSNPLYYAEHLYIDGKEVTDVVIPDGVTSIGNYAFNGCSGLTSVTIPNSVTSIGDDAFEGCSGLTSINIPDGVTSIGRRAFSGCSSLTSITIPSSVTNIGEYAFYGCNSLTTLNFNAEKCAPMVNDYGGYGYVFDGCSSLTTVNIGESVEYIPSYAFYGCSGLTSITIPDGVTSIGGSAFSDCSGLSSISVDADNQYFNSRDNCNAIIETSTNTLIVGCKNTIIPDDVTSIGNFAFSGCRGLTSINIPDGVTSIGSGAFGGCSSLTSINIPDGVTIIEESVFNGCNSLTSVTIPDGVTSIGTMAFSSCKSLTSIAIPDGVTSLEYGVFCYCQGLKNVTIPNSITSMEWGVFFMCDNLEYVNTDMVDPSILIDQFGTDKTYVVPCALYDTYVAAGLTTESEHLFTTYTYNNDAEVGVDGTETAYCDNNCGHTDTRTAEGTKLIPTGVGQVSGDSQRVIKTIEGGRVVIIRDGVKYDIMGRKLIDN
ncbi:MAG: leucine-rich repeat domain-containing protein [Bacteroidales bacterium]|nr:leucine-rich repeat domain-containing protein [Bacteroidales bacterium]